MYRLLPTPLLVLMAMLPLLGGLSRSVQAGSEPIWDEVIGDFDSNGIYAWFYETSTWRKLSNLDP